MDIRIENLTKTYGNLNAVDHMSLNIKDGELVGLLGPSGCGKSTTLFMLSGLTTPTTGKIFFGDKDVTNIPPEDREIGLVFQNYALYPHMTVEDNITFPLINRGVKKAAAKEMALEMAKVVKIDQLMNRKPGELSGGQQQRVAIARALVKKPQVLLLDEPLSNLDAKLRVETREEIRRIQQEVKITTIFVTHDQEEAMSISDSILLMKDGLLIQSGLCQELYVNPNSLFVAEFLGNPPANKIEITDAVVEFLENTKELKNTAAAKTIAIRPEAFTLDSNGIESEILFISEMGKDQIVTMKFLGNTVRAILNLDDDSLTAGSKIKVGLKRKGVFTFDKAGRRLA